MPESHFGQTKLSHSKNGFMLSCDGVPLNSKSGWASSLPSMHQKSLVLILLRIR
jgi:hypothetical protein